MTALEELKSSARDSIKDQKRARERSRNPFFWLAWIAETIVEMFIQIGGSKTGSDRASSATRWRRSLKFR
jgi:hypothetical protein